MIIDSDIAVVGGGATGALVAANVLRACTAPVRVAVIDAAPALGRGVAFGTTCDDHLLNVPASGMSALADEPDHFLKWLQRSDAAATPTTFAPRRVYGEYVGTVLAHAKEQGSRCGGELVRINGRAIEARDLGDRGVLIVDGGTTVLASRVVLALGNFPPAPIPGLSGERASNRYISDPWAPRALNAISKSDQVLLVGTGLTMYDVLLTLQRRHEGPTCTAISRNGLRPEVHDLSLGPPPPPRFGETSSLNDIARAVEEASADDAEWRRRIDSIRPLTPGLWRDLPLDERRAFLAKWRRSWDVKRHRAAPDVDARVRSYESEGTLRIEKAALVRADASADRIVIELDVDGTRRTRTFDFVVNCTGPQSDYRRLNDPLVASLRDAGTLTPCPLGLGIETDGTCGLVDGSGGTSGVFFAVGPPTKPMLWEITAIPEIRQQTQALAIRLLEEVKPHQAPALV